MTADSKDPTPRPFEIEHDLQKEAERMPPAATSPTAAAAARPRRAKSSRGATKAAKRASDLPPVAPTPPLALRPWTLVLTGAFLALITWLGYQNPYVGVGEHTGFDFWPWEAFRENTSDGGPLVFRWDPIRIFALGGALLTLLLVIGSILRSSPARGAFLFVITGIAAVLFWKDVMRLGDATTMTLHVAGAVLAGAILLRDGTPAGHGRRWLLFAALLLVAGILFFPRAGGAGVGAYDPIALAFLEPFRVLAHLPGQSLVTPDMALGLDHAWSVDGLHAMGLTLLVGLGLVTLIGMRGRWTPIAATALVLLTAFVPPLAHHLADAPLLGANEASLLTLLGSPHWTLLFGLSAILVAGILSWIGLGGRWTAGVAGVGLGVVVLVVASRHYALGLQTTPGAEPLWAGLAGAAVWLGPGLGAFLLPVAAGVLDQRSGPSAS